MAYTTIDDPSAYFQTHLYAGSNSDITATFSGNSDLQPDWIWFKSRSSDNDHLTYDSVRGVGKRLQPNATDAEVDRSGNNDELKSFNTNGWTLGTFNSNITGAGKTCVSWNWKAGTSVSGNTSGGTAKAYSGSVSTDAGISIITYLGNDNSAHVVPHHLGVAPELTIIKERSNADIWVVQNVYSGFGNYMTLHTNSASATNGGNFITSVSSSAVTMNENAVNNANDESYILYSFASKQGYSKIGTYIGNGNADGPFIPLSFEPAFLIYKRTDTAKSWYMNDNKRDVHNPVDGVLLADATDAENASHGNKIDFLSNGFKSRSTGSTVNSSGGTYLYMAFAENPFVTSTGVPATAR